VLPSPRPRGRVWVPPRRWCRSRSWSRRGCRCRCRCGGRARRRCRHRPLHLKRADVDTPVTHSIIKTRPALVVEGRRSEVRVTRINGWASGQQLMRECGPAIVLQWAKHRIGIDLIARGGQHTAAVVAAEIVAGRPYEPPGDTEITSCRTGLQDGVSDPYSTPGAMDAAAAATGRVAAEGAVADLYSPPPFTPGVEDPATNNGG